MSETWQVVIIGGGAAGLAAACTLSMHGDVSALALDESPQPGERQKRMLEAAFPGFAANSLKNVRWSGSSRVIGIFDDRRIFFEDERNQIREVQAKVILLATGARERFIPFKGWELPGVISLGYARNLAEERGVLPGKLTVMAGSGPLLYPATASVIGVRGKIGAVLDAGSIKEKLAWIKASLLYRMNLPEAFGCAWQLAVSRTRIYPRRMLVEAAGKAVLQGVVSARIDAVGRKLSGTELHHNADAAAIGNGFVPNIALARQAQCDLEYVEHQGGWVVKTDERLGAGPSGIFAAGEITGIGGVQKALIEGRLAALSMLRHLEMISETQFCSASQGLARLRKRFAPWSKCIHQLSRVSDTWVDWIDDDAVICRCENVRMGQIRKAVHEGFSSQVLLKKALRVGMGYCQARTCGSMIEEIVSALTRTCPSSLNPLTVRPPISPISIKALAGAAVVTAKPVSVDESPDGLYRP